MREWLNKLISKDESEVSLGHVSSLFLILYLAGLVGLLVWRSGSVVIPDIPQGWVWVVGILWGVPKVADAVKGVSGDKVG